jgi:hypothetical protein
MRASGLAAMISLLIFLDTRTRRGRLGTVVARVTFEGFVQPDPVAYKRNEHRACANPDPSERGHAGSAALVGPGLGRGQMIDAGAAKRKLRGAPFDQAELKSLSEPGPYLTVTLPAANGWRQRKSGTRSGAERSLTQRNADAKPGKRADTGVVITCYFGGGQWLCDHPPIGEHHPDLSHNPHHPPPGRLLLPCSISA